jgi:hypothetical protein
MSNRYTPRSILLAVLVLFLLATCGRSPQSGSALENAAEFETLAASTGPEAVAARCILWLTDTTESDTLLSGIADALSKDELTSIRASVSQPSMPARADFLEKEAREFLALFSGADSSAHSGGRFWLNIKTDEESLIEISLVNEPEGSELFDLAELADARLCDIIAGAEVERVGRSPLLRLRYEDYPDMETLRSGLRDFFTGRAVERIVQKLGVFSRDGVLWMPEIPRRPVRSWQSAEIAERRRNDRGFVARVQLSTGPGEYADIEIPFILTFEGWRIDGEM